eukprot:TRINITY_DN1792_c0_g8_i1.p1 TRINITY_DN1792_c0_g8~~TRINITY_DN1792_c0_g8_i1.p1  ORF type:complete len:354 (+),score=28.77 TRINITY_DN1792_c0_g8_i1:34-1062(+)
MASLNRTPSFKEDGFVLPRGHETDYNDDANVRKFRVRDLRRVVGCEDLLNACTGDTCTLKFNKDGYLHFSILPTEQECQTIRADYDRLHDTNAFPHAEFGYKTQFCRTNSVFGDFALDWSIESVLTAYASARNVNVPDLTFCALDTRRFSREWVFRLRICAAGYVGDVEDAGLGKYSPFILEEDSHLSVRYRLQMARETLDIALYDPRDDATLQLPPPSFSRVARERPFLGPEQPPDEYIANHILDIPNNVHLGENLRADFQDILRAGADLVGKTLRYVTGTTFSYGKRLWERADANADADDANADADADADDANADADDDDAVVTRAVKTLYWQKCNHWFE